MNGAHALLGTLKANGVTHCFANPGTSEMHFVAALDDEPALKGILCLFEGVATGAADGYARVSAHAAVTLLHLGPGLANGWANLHNARRAHSPVLNVVGDHATYHGVYDAPLQSNLELLGHSLSGHYVRSTRPDDVATDTAASLAAAYGPPGQVATLVLPADVSWGELKSPPPSWPVASRAPRVPVDEAELAKAVAALRTRRCALVVGGEATSAAQLALARRVAAATDARLFMETFPARLDRGAGVASAERLIYVSEFAIDQLKDAEVVIVVGAREPVSFFAYPDVASRLSPEDAPVIALAPPGSDTQAALSELVSALRAPDVTVSSGERVGAPQGALTAASFAAAVGYTLPEDAIVVDESNTSGVHLFEATSSSPPHQWLTLAGGSIGFGLPVALGAAVASGQRVLALESDGSMMYTLQALWTMARENLNVTVVGLANESYAILKYELARVGTLSHGAASARLLELNDPTLDLAGLAAAQGVPSERVESADDLAAALSRSYDTPGPTFIEARLSRSAI